MNNEQKTPLALSLNNLAIRAATDAIQLLGQALPASVVSISGEIVTVKFEVNSTFTLPQVTIPLATSKYRHEPIQAGDYGVVFPCDTKLGGITGLGSGVAMLAQPPNLSALVFFPVGNKNWTPVTDPNMFVATGLSDVMLRDNTHQVQLENVNTSWISLITQLNALLLVIGPLLSTPTVLTPILATTNPVKPRV